MANMTEPERVESWARWMRENKELCAFTKHDLKEAIDATDAWIDANALSFALALPAAVRNNTTKKQKVFLFLKVAEHRYEVDA